MTRVGFVHHRERRADIADEVDTPIAKGGRRAVFEEMPDEWTDRAGVIGDVPACRAMMDALIEAGAGEIALAPVSPSGLVDQIARAGTGPGPGHG